MIETLVAMLAAGESYRSVGRMLDIPHTTIARTARRPDVAARIKQMRRATSSAERKRQRRDSVKRTANDPTYPGPGSRPEHDPQPQRRAALSDSPPLEDLPGYDAAPRRKSRSGGGRLVPFSGGSIFDGPVAVSLARGRPTGSRWQARPPTTQELDERASMLTARDGKRTYRIDPADRAEYEQAGFLVS